MWQNEHYKCSASFFHLKWWVKRKERSFQNSFVTHSRGVERERHSPSRLNSRIHTHTVWWVVLYTCCNSVKYIYYKQQWVILHPDACFIITCCHERWIIQYCILNSFCVCVFVCCLFRIFSHTLSGMVLPQTKTLLYYGGTSFWN